MTEADQAVDVLAVRKRPPYDYGDLAIASRGTIAERLDDAGYKTLWDADYPDDS